MDIILFNDKDTWIHRLDPRGRILAAAALSIVLSVSHHGSTLALGLVLGCGAVAAARVPAAAVLQRLVPLNTLLFLLCVLLLFFTPGERLFQIGAVEATREGFQQGLLIGLKANGIVLLLAALLGTIEPVALGYAMSRLRVPPMLAHIFLFTIRYMGLMLSEFDRLSRAAQLRGFTPGLNRHTLRTTGYMVGMMLVRSYARGERILNAMRLRGYHGVLAFGGELAYRARDGVFAAFMIASVALLVGLEWR